MPVFTTIELNQSPPALILVVDECQSMNRFIMTVFAGIVEFERDLINKATSLELFESWLRKGLGRAVTFLAQNREAPYRNAVLHACLHNITYDAQLEEARGEYLWMLIEHSGDREFFRDAVLQHLTQASQESEYDWPQIFYVAQQFATEGDSEMRHAMYSAFDLLRFSEAGPSLATSLIQLAPLEGFVFAVDRFDTSSSEDDWWMLASLITDLEERVGKAEAERLIASAVATHTSVENVIGAYRRHEEEQRQASQRSHSEQLDLQALRNMPGGRSWAWRFRRWALNASPEELSAATKEFLSDENPEKAWGCLRAFALRPFPGDLRRLLELCDSDHDRVRRAAVVALSKIRDPLVRAHGLMLVQSNERFTDGIELLESNYDESDFRILNDAVRRSSTPEKIHGIGMTVRNIVMNDVRPELEPVLLLLYEAGPCSLCRTAFVEALIKLERLPESIRDECRFDAEPDTRRAVCASLPC